MSRELILTKTDKENIMGMYYQNTETHINEFVSPLIKNLFGAAGKAGARAAGAAGKAGIGLSDDILKSSKSGIAQGWRGAPMYSGIMSQSFKILTTQWGRVDWKLVGRWLMGIPTRPGVLKNIYQTLGLGPAILALGTGLLKQWLGLMLLISGIRGLLATIEYHGLSSLRSINEFFGIQPFNDNATTVIGSIISNTANNIYVPGQFVALRAWKAVPWIFNNGIGVLSYINDLLKSIFTPKNSEKNFVETLKSYEEYFGKKADKILDKSKEIPEEVLSQIPSDKRSQISMNENGIYWGTPEYKITTIANKLVVYVPGEGWYDINDVE